MHLCPDEIVGLIVAMPWAVAVFTLTKSYVLRGVRWIRGFFY